jgi:hypothetical protein
MTATTTSLSAVLKTLYPQSAIKELCYDNNPLLGLVKKKTDFGGKNGTVSLRYAAQGGRSSVFATAQTNRSPNLYEDFIITRAKDYAVGGIDTEALRAAKGNKNALIEGLEAEMKGLTYSITRSLCASLYGNGGGAVGQIASGSASTTITLTNPADVVWFEVGDVIEASDDDGTTGSLHAGSNEITAVDRDAGTLTAAVQWDTAITGLGANDYLFHAGDFGAKLTGLAGWLPASAPTSGDSFFGVDRSADTVRLAGIRFNGAGGPIEEVLQGAMARAFREGARVDTVLMNPVDMNSLTISLGSRTQYIRATSGDMPEVGYEAAKIVAPSGSAKVIADPNCPQGTAYGLQMDTWTLWSLGDCPGFLDDDGNKMLRDSDADSLQVRLGYYANLYCDAPGFNVRITL